MQPEPIPNTDHAGSVASSLPTAWQQPLAMLALAVFSLVMLAAREWSEMFHQWWNIDTYNHIVLIPAVIAWLVWIRRDDLRDVKPRPWLPGLGLIVAALGLWLVGRASGINLLAHAGAVGTIQAAIVTILGVRVALLVALPLTVAVFLVPFGDEMIPALQMITAKIAIALTKWSDIPAQISGIYIDTPVGLFIVAEACSGVKFLIAMVTLAVLVCLTQFESWSRRAIFMLAAILVPILANGVRAWGTIYIAQSQGVEFAAGFDHIVYGWVFFGIVIALVLGAAWRFFERDADDAGFTNDNLDQMSWVGKSEKRSASAAKALVGIVLLATSAGAIAAIVGQSGLG